jgi:hypothetical protein
MAHFLQWSAVTSSFTRIRRSPSSKTLRLPATAAGDTLNSEFTNCRRGRDQRLLRRRSGERNLGNNLLHRGTKARNTWTTWPSAACGKIGGKHRFIAREISVVNLRRVALLAANYTGVDEPLGMRV